MEVEIIDKKAHKNVILIGEEVYSLDICSLANDHSNKQGKVPNSRPTKIITIAFNF